MIWLVTESYGFQWEDSWDNIIGYYNNQEDAESHRQRLEDKYNNWVNNLDEYNRLDDLLRSKVTDNQEAYDKYDEEVKELNNQFGYSDSYSFDWYDVHIEKVEKLSKS